MAIKTGRATLFKNSKFYPSERKIILEAEEKEEHDDVFKIIDFTD